MKAPFLGQIPPPQAWRPAETGGKDGLTLSVGSEQRAALHRLADSLKALPLHKITRDHVRDPLVLALTARVREGVMHGRGAVILSGIDIENYAPEDYGRLYWALGTQLGRGVVQGYRGDLVARVEVDPTGPVRGTTTDMELRPHTDFHELMALASISQGESGGISGFVSSLAIHNAILERRPDLLPPLYEGYYHLSQKRRRLTDTPVPIYCVVDGQVSCFFNRVFMMGAAEARGEPIPAKLAEAMAFMDELAASPEFKAEFVLEPGEIVFWHNFLVMHARTQFRDAPDRKRLLLRLWLHAWTPRPLDPSISAWTATLDEEHLAFGVDPALAGA